MEERLFSLTPKRYLCPYCGEWHEWSKAEYLGYYESKENKVNFTCSEYSKNRSKICDYSIYFIDDYMYYSIESICNKLVKKKNEGKILISSIREDPRFPRVTFDIYIDDYIISRDYCSKCDFKYNCNFHRLATQVNDCKGMKITLGFEFERSEYNKIAKIAKIIREKELQQCKLDMSRKKQDFQMPQVKENKEETTMENNIFNMNMEFGPNKDKNIRSTIMGVAVKNNNSWRIYDKKKKEITDVGNLQLGEFDTYIIPTTKLSEGDLIKDAGEYYFVKEVSTSNIPTQTLLVRTGEMKNVVPIKNAMGFSCYSKVIALSDSFNMGDNFDVENMAIMSAMCGQNAKDSGQMNQLLPLMLFKDKLGGDDDMMKVLLMSSMNTSSENGGQMNQLLPLMLFKDKLGGDDDMMKMLLMSSMNTSSENSGQMNQLLPLMLFKDKLGEDDDMMKMLLMYSMMGSNNMEGSNNPLMSYLMINTFMDKKEDKVLENPLEIAN